MVQVKAKTKAQIHQEKIDKFRLFYWRTNHDKNQYAYQVYADLNNIDLNVKDAKIAKRNKRTALTGVQTWKTDPDYAKTLVEMGEIESGLTKAQSSLIISDADRKLFARVEDSDDLNTKDFIALLTLLYRRFGSFEQPDGGNQVPVLVFNTGNGEAIDANGRRTINGEVVVEEPKAATDISEDVSAQIGEVSSGVNSVPSFNVSVGNMLGEDDDEEPKAATDIEE